MQLRYPIPNMAQLRRELLAVIEAHHTSNGIYDVRAQRDVFEAAKQRHPERWSGDIRKLSLPEVVHLNPERDPVPQAAGF